MNIFTIKWKMQLQNMNYIGVKTVLNQSSAEMKLISLKNNKKSSILLCWNKNYYTEL